MALYTVETHGELHPFLEREWLLTNGKGAMSFSTVVGCNMRRYHGLLCAATMPPVGRVMALNRIGELVYLDGKSDYLELSINQFRNSLHPRGDRYLRRFELGDIASFHYELDGIKIIKDVQLVWGRNTAGIRYRIEAPPERQVRLELLPFVSLRDFHALRQAPGANFDVKAEAFEMAVGESGTKNTLHFRADAGEFIKQGDWWYGHTYPIETDRGQDDSEDLFAPGRLIYNTRGSSTLTLWASMEGSDALQWDTELARRPEAFAGPLTVVSAPGAKKQQGGDATEAPVTPILKKLIRAADDFVVSRRRPDGKPGVTVIAGYPWFADWGRDTMISLPGLLLTTRKFQKASQVLTLFAEYVSEGMIPNKFDDYNNEPSYNTVDASLWFIHACFEYHRLSGDAATFNGPLLAACRAIVKGHQAGTRFGIRMDADGLITAGDEHTQLTWMDAKHGGIAFTPRHGKAVEINALWYNALRLLGEEQLAAKVKESFIKAFWFNPYRGLYDVVSNDLKKRDAAIRPNQIFAASLPYSPLDEAQQKAVVETVRRELLTPYGLRTLNRSDPNYIGRYTGPQSERDRAYHNGVIWPWLIGPFLEAYLRVNHFSPDAQRQARVWLQPLLDHMHTGCIGQISECFTGDDPHKPVGCPAQAWSVAEVLRLATLLRL